MNPDDFVEEDRGEFEGMLKKESIRIEYTNQCTDPQVLNDPNAVNIGKLPPG